MATSTTAAEPPSSVTNTNVQNPEAPPSTNVQTNENVQGAVSPQVEALRAMFPDFDVAVLQSVLESVNNDQERALDVLLGMSDPEYVSTQTAAQPAPSQMDLDEQLARQLLMEDQQQQRHASGTSWPRRSEDVPYQARQHHPEPNRLPSPEGGVGKSDFQELQRTMGQIAESGKRTFSSIVSRVKAKINEYDQSRNGSGQSSGSSTTPQWGSAPPTQIDRHTASQAYQQQYFGPGSTTQSQYNPDAEPHQISLQDNTQVTGYNVDAPSTRNQPQPLAAPVPTPAARSTSPVASGLSPAASPRPSSDVPRPPPTVTGSPVNAAKIGLLPKKPVSLLNTNSPPATRPSDDDDELEYVENPFEERK
ncbi:hypothetical protein L227DRAFT_513636 [Lentinus tigrinus ALCF2SS1-6]|uniref:CUE domain-containing protein n=1 Tax=Lentinus tigrinus ALCF2SS1-6 TaxID=1328759 RepID=A0A5C2RRR4_9APHY|nr:hypothetical protein L227DRAFT_513636 [Lentinus tigrinus ALCF2SS1-6]